MESWGWRVPFLVAGPIGLVGLYMRLKLDETPAFQKLESEGALEKRESTPFRQILTTQWRPMVLCIALVAAFNVTDYMLLSYMPTYLSNSIGYDSTDALVSIIIVMLVLMAAITFVGRLSDRIGRKPVMMAGSLGFLVLSVPCFLLIKMGTVVSVFAGLLILGLCLLPYVSVMSSSLPALFPTDVRYGSLSIAFNISVSLFGGTTPLVVEGLVSGTGNDMMPAYYTMLAALVGVIAVVTMKETARRPLPGSPPSVSTPEEAAELVAASRPVSYTHL